MSETLGLCSWMIGSVISGLLDPHSTEACPSGVLLEMSLRSPTEELACTVPTEQVRSSSTPLTPSSEVLLTSRLNLPILDGVWEDNPTSSSMSHPMTAMVLEYADFGGTIHCYPTSNCEAGQTGNRFLRIM
ncbi:hypothetical protein BDP67DRAFT_567466 [Colletotrichum lupini]|nr:hypothetical protein BDP67DRAFT_567466 [Colletotrichum lupini]